MSSASRIAPTFSETSPQSAWVTPSGLSMAMRTSGALPPPLTSTSTSSRPSDCATCCAISSIFAATIATTSRMVPELPPPTKKWAFAHRIGSTTQTIVYRVYGNCGSAEYGGGDRGVRGHTLGRSSWCSQVTTWVRRRCRTGGWRRCGRCHRGWRHDPEGPPTCVHSHGTRRSASECAQEKLGQQLGGGRGQQLTAEIEFGLAVAVGQEAVIADAL